MSISTKQLAALGWKRTNPGAIFPMYEHVDGWKLQHCCHATALYPYFLHAPKGEWVPAPNGKGFQNVQKAVEWLQPTLAGIDHNERDKASDEAQVEELNRILRTPLKDVSHEAGEIERKSPLFYGKGENPTLFGGD